MRMVWVAILGVVGLLERSGLGPEENACLEEIREGVPTRQNTQAVPRVLGRTADDLNPDVRLERKLHACAANGYASLFSLRGRCPSPPHSYSWEEEVSPLDKSAAGSARHALKACSPIVTSSSIFSTGIGALREREDMEGRTQEAAKRKDPSSLGATSPPPCSGPSHPRIPDEPSDSRKRDSAKSLVARSAVCKRHSSPSRIIEAEGAGFEPAVDYHAYAWVSARWFRPLTHPSVLLAAREDCFEAGRSVAVMESEHKYAGET